MIGMNAWLKRAVLMLLMAFASFISMSTVWAEVATAKDDSEDALVVGKIIQQQQANNSTSQSASQVLTTASDVKTTVADDMQAGQTQRSLPTLDQPVIDQAKLLNASDVERLNQKIKTLYQQGKAQIGVIIVPTTGQEDIFSYAMRVAEQWKLGSAKRDNGLLIAVAVNDRRIQIVTGYGLEGVLPDVMVSRIIRNNITPLFKQGQYAQGIEGGLDAISQILNQDPEIAKQAADDLKKQHDDALHAEQARDRMFLYTAIILVVGIFASFIVGNRLSAATAGVAAVTAGVVSGVGLVTSLFLGVAVFFLLVTSLAQIILQAVLSGGGGRGGGSGGFGGGGGYSGGGGSFGGGGASGSW
ncbi:MAG: TPM domain-containing protein [Acinetobacter sp.]